MGILRPICRQNKIIIFWKRKLFFFWNIICLRKNQNIVSVATKREKAERFYGVLQMSQPHIDYVFIDLFYDKADAE